ncbi:MAG: aminotransferase class I/II-fold pyridoxal phosphate-dependent enzyme [Phycisphaerales bacterium]|nr:aminotransferase class I/II-fold pyridoxal phosphate-dependent enzyme [Phycisphaerales bacterium]
MPVRSFIAERIQSIGSSGIRKIFDLAATMADPIDLSLGQPDFAVPQAVKQAAIDAIRNDRNNYTVTHGLPALRDRILSGLVREFDWRPACLVTSGVSGGLVLALMACLNPGDEVLFADPYFVSYTHLVRLFGGTPVPVPVYDRFRLNAAAFEAAVTPRTKIIVINSPANPTGVVHGADEIEGIARLAERHDLLVISDEIYQLLSYDGPAASPVSFAPARTLLLRGFGKSYGMTGWRMGYAAGPEAIIAQMAKLQQFTFVCAPHMAQVGCITALDTDMSRQINDYRGKRDLIARELGDGYEFARPSGGFFVFPRIPAGYDSATQFVEAAIRNNLLVIPGNAFSARDTHFRVSYAVPDERIKRGCEVLRQLAERR